jgi:hypothetical protein
VSGRSATAKVLRRPFTTAEVARALEVDASPSRFVSLQDDQIARVARHVANRAASQQFERAAWDNGLFWNVEADAEQRSQYFAIGNAVNFRFWRLDGKRVVPAAGLIDGQSFRGAMYMWRSLKRCIEKGELPLLDAGFLAGISEIEFDAIFADDSGANPLDVARDERIANVRDLGKRLLESWDGLFYNLAASSDGSIVEFAQLSSNLRAFDDPVFKLTMVNAIVHSGSGVYTFRDEPLPAIDYHLLRHALRQGLVVPRPSLAAKLQTREFLDPEEAFELRRVALQAFVRLAEESGQSGEVIDNNYWLNRANCADEPVCLDPAHARECPFLDVCVQETSFQLPLELTRYY